MPILTASGKMSVKTASSCSARNSGVDFKNVGDAGGVLGGQGGDGAHGKNAVGGHGLDVGLDTGASAGIAASNGQCCFHRRYFLSYMHSKVL